MSSTIISRVFQDCYCQLEGSLYSGQLVGHLYREKCINLEDKQQIEAESTQFAKSRKLIDILSKKADSALDHILAHLHNDGSQSHLKRQIHECALKFGYFGEAAESPTGATRTKVQILGQTWWPEHKEMIKSFVDRSAPDGGSLVAHLRQQLLNSEVKATAITSGKQTIVGMGGIGKTSTAKWYANEYQDEYDHIIWVDSEASSLGNSMERLGRKLDMKREPNVPLEEFVKNIYDRLQTARCLFVFDNAERLDGENGLRDHLPRNELHHSIITSRNRDWGNSNEFGQIPIFQLDVFTPAECITLLSNTLSPIRKAGTEEQMLALGEELGFLPVALQCAVATIQKSRSYTLVSYTSRIQDDLKILVDKKILSEYERPISAALHLSIEQIEKDEEIDEQCREWCKTILTVAAYCEPEGIPEALFVGFRTANRDVVSDALDVLHQYSLVSIDNLFGLDDPTDEDEYSVVTKMLRTHITEFSIHRLLQHVIRDKDLVDSDRAIRTIKVALKWIVANEEFHSHGVRAWTLAAAQFDDILLSCHDIPLGLNYPAGFLENALASLRRIFKETDLPIVQLKLRLVDEHLEDDDWEGANGIVGEMFNVLANASAEDAPHHVQLKLHLCITALEVRQYKMRRYDSKANVEPELVEEYETLLRELAWTGYNGEIAGACLCYPAEYRQSGFTLRGYMEVCYARILQKVGRSDEAITAATNFLKTNEIDIGGLYTMCKMFQEEPKFESMIAKAFQKLRQLITQPLPASNDEAHYEALSIIEMYAEYVWTFKPNSLSDHFEVLHLLLEFDFDSDPVIRAHFSAGSGQSSIDLFFVQISKISALKEFRQELWHRADNALNTARKKLVRAFKANVCDDDEYVTNLVALDNIHTRILEECGDDTLNRILELDRRSLTLLVNSKINWSRFHQFVGSDLLPTALLNNLAGSAVNARICAILESKLGILLHILCQSVPDVKLMGSTNEFISVMDTYDCACSALVLLDRMEEAVPLWIESVEFMKNKALGILQMARIGKQTLKLLEDRQQHSNLRQFMEIMDECFQQRSTDFFLSQSDPDDEDSRKQLKEIATLILRLVNCNLLTTALELISGLTKCDKDGARTPLIHIDTDLSTNAGLKEAGELARAALVDIQQHSAQSQIPNSEI